MLPKFTCNFSLYSPAADVIQNAIMVDENRDAMTFNAVGDVLHVKIESEDFRSFMKTITFFMERFKLSNETIRMCEDEFILHK